MVSGIDKRHRYITAWGETKTLTEWLSSPRTAPLLERSAFWNRVNIHKMSTEDALTKPVSGVHLIRGKYMRIKDAIGNVPGLTRDVVNARLELGWDIDRACTVLPLERRKQIITAWGETRTLTVWLSDERATVGLTWQGLYCRIHRTKMTPELAICTPLRGGRVARCTAA